MLYFFICLLHPGNVKKKKFFLKLCLKTKQAAPHHCCLWALPRSCGGQRPGGHFSADANRVQREVRSREKPEAAAPRAAWDLHLTLVHGFSVSEPGGRRAGRGQAGRCCVERAEDWKPSKHPARLHVHELSLPVSPICAPASNLLLLRRKELF